MRPLILAVALGLTGCVTHAPAPLPTSLDFPQCVAHPYHWTRATIFDPRTNTTLEAQCISEPDANVWDRCREELKAFRDAWRRIEDARR